jgi:glycosyltransferase involved in cell wall biosynthesis
MKISVCIATFNGGRFIQEQVMSVLPQLGEEDEMVVSDDGSTDDTIPILKSFHDPRISIWQNNGRHGFIWNFENALTKAMGDVIFLCDQDDIWKPNKVETVMTACRIMIWCYMMRRSSIKMATKRVFAILTGCIIGKASGVTCGRPAG